MQDQNESKSLERYIYDFKLNLSQIAKSYALVVAL